MYVNKKEKKKSESAPGQHPPHRGKKQITEGSHRVLCGCFLLLAFSPVRWLCHQLFLPKEKEELVHH